jgi:ParB family chromosome partitioning protein
MKQAATVTPPAPPAALFQPIPTTDRMAAIGDLIESKTNPRKKYDQKKLDELTASARKYGILEPLLCRPAGDKRFEIVAGSRRFRAGKAAELVDLPIRVANYSDEQVLEIQLIENSQRDDVHPLEQAEGFARLLKLKNYTPEIIADRIGHEVSFVYKRLKLIELIDPLKKLFEDERMTIGHAIALCRLSADDQALAMKDALFGRDEWIPNANGSGVKYQKPTHARPLRELEAWIHQNVLLVLKDAPWKKDDAELVPAAGACNTCTKRTGANLSLFDDVSAKDDRCLDRVCFAGKRSAFIKAVKASHPEAALVARSYMTPGEAKSAGVTIQNAKIAAAGCKKTTPGIVANKSDKDFGQLVIVCTDPKCRTHRSYSAPSSKKPSTAELISREKAEINRKVIAAARRQVFETLTNATKPKMTGGFISIEPDELRPILNYFLGGVDDEAALLAYLGITVKPKKRRGMVRAVIATRDLESVIFANGPVAMYRAIFYCALADNLIAHWDAKTAGDPLLELAEKRKVKYAAFEAAARKQTAADFEVFKAKLRAAAKAKKKPAPGSWAVKRPFPKAKAKGGAK